MLHSAVYTTLYKFEVFAALNALWFRYFTKLCKSLYPWEGAYEKQYIKECPVSAPLLICRSYVQEHNCWDRMWADSLHQIQTTVCLRPCLKTLLQLPGPDIIWLDQPRVCSHESCHIYAAQVTQLWCQNHCSPNHHIIHGT